MSRPNQLLQGLIRSPFLWGLLGSTAFYVLVLSPKGPLNQELIRRYFTKHPVEYMLTVMFAIGLAALLLKAFDVVGQRIGLRDSVVDGVPRSPNVLDHCIALLSRLDRLPGGRQREYYVCRLRAALEHVRQRTSADALDDELKYLSDVDASRLHAGYGLFRVIVWAIPILGFLGTVIGITMALNSVDLQAPDQSMLLVLNGLGLKFDTTALALTLSMVLMFVHFYVERAETSLLEEVDRRVQADLGGRFTAVPVARDGQVAAMQRMLDSMQQVTETLLKRQTEIWQAAVDSAGRQWVQMSETAAQQVAASMAAATGELGRRGEVLERAVAAAGEVTRMEDALNRNLSALAGAKHFEQTVLSLAAVVNMLSARLTEMPAVSASVKLEPSRRTSHAA